MTSKVYDVRWVDADGPQGYYVKMSKKQAKDLRARLEAAVQKGKITELEVDPIEGDRVVSAKDLVELFEERYS